MRGKSNSYEPPAINFHLQETSPREPQGRGRNVHGFPCTFRVRGYSERLTSPGARAPTSPSWGELKKLRHYHRKNCLNTLLYTIAPTAVTINEPRQPRGARIHAASE